MKTHSLIAALVLTIPAWAEDKPAPAPSPVPDAAAATVYAPTDLAKLKEMTGKQVVVEGTVLAQGENKSGTVRYLNFTKNYKESLALVFLLGKNAEAFSKEKLAEYVGKKVKVSGTVGAYNETLQIKIDKLDQIQVQP